MPLNLISLAAALALAPTLRSGPPKNPTFPIQKFQLSNGLHVVLSVDHSAPIVGLALSYNVGSRSEQKGRTGFAHLFEHLMFAGSAHVPRGMLDRYIEGSGGISNAFTRDEDTTYIESVPSEKLPLILWLEADRMRSLDVSNESLKNQQQVVKEEKRLRVDNQPYASADVKLQELAYSNFANQHQTIGSMADIDAAKLADVRAFFKMFYAPNNATLVLVGDLTPDVAMHYINLYFGDIPRHALPLRPSVYEPRQSGARSATVADPLARLPALYMAWSGPSYSNPDHYAMDMLAQLLFGSDSSRSYLGLVKGRQLAVQISGSLNTERGPSLFEVSSIYRPNVQQPVMQQALEGLMNKLKGEPPSLEELNRVKTSFRAARYLGQGPFGLQSDLGRAIQIAADATLQGDPDMVNQELNHYMAVTPADIQRVARKYFLDSAKTVVIVKPGTGSPQGGAPR